MKRLLAIAILGSVFFLNILGRNMPMHVDSWLAISIASDILRHQRIPLREPFTGTPLSAPIGNSIFQAVFSGITGMDLLPAALLLPALLNLGLAALIYTLAKALFKNPEAAIAAMAFTPLVLTNITMLGPYLLVSLSFGMVAVLLFLFMIAKEKWLLATLFFPIIPIMHTSSMVFALSAVTLHFLFTRRHRGKILFLAVLFALSLAIFGLLRGFGLLAEILSTAATFEKSLPFFQFARMLGWGFFSLLGIGIYLIALDERKASRQLLPVFVFMALNLWLYWLWRGFLLVYRRLISFMFLLVPFFVGYAVFRLSGKRIAVLSLLILILFPLAVLQNINSRENLQVYVTKEEHELLKGFGERHPNAYLLTDHLEAYALPYYNLRPVFLSPAHGANTSYYYEAAHCYFQANLSCLADFMDRHGFKYLYTGKPIQSPLFEPCFGELILCRKNSI